VPAPPPPPPAPSEPAATAPAPVPADEPTVESSQTQPFAPPGTESTWLEPLPGPPPSAPQTAEVESATAFVPFAAPTAAADAPAGTNAAPEATEGPISNGGFERSTEGWRGSNSELTLVPGVTGKAVRVTRANSRSAFAIVAGKPVTSPRRGARYRAGTFVRSVSPGMFVCLRVEEFSGSRVPITTERCSAATTGWQRLKVETRTTAKGSRVVFSVRVIAALGGTSFDVDGFRLR
jgi:hypothetical protein